MPCHVIFTGYFFITFIGEFSALNLSLYTYVRRTYYLFEYLKAIEKAVNSQAIKLERINNIL